MSQPSAVILGIESSCDETAAAIVVGGREVRSNVIATQHDLHEAFAGVVPEIASRAHLERIVPVVRLALQQAGVRWGDIDAVAVGHRPGLIGSLLVGVSAAKAIAWSLERPLIGVDHVIAHLWAAVLDGAPIEYPAIGFVVSGGHTSMYHMAGPIELTRLGTTIDDAVGEAFDKAATILGLGYPGGPAIEQAARSGDPLAHELPVSMLDSDSLDFSFSGLKTALLYAARGTPGGLPIVSAELGEQARADFAASFQHAAVTALVRKLERALERAPDVRSIVLGGGVSANTHLRERVTNVADRHGLVLRLPQPAYCIDNAAMIAGLAEAYYAAGESADLSLAASTQTILQ